MSMKPPLGALPNYGHPLSRGLVGCWLMNEGGGSQVHDLSGNGYHGTSTGVWVPGNFGPAIDCSSGSVTVTTFDEALAGLSTMTVLVWARNYEAANTSGSDELIAQSGSGNDTFFIYWAQGDEIAFDATGTDAALTAYTAIATPDLLNADIWHQFVGRADGVNNEMLVDISYLTGSAAREGTMPSVAHDLVIGVSGQWIVDHVIIWSRALSNSEIASLYDDPFQMFPSDPIELWTGATSVGAASSSSSSVSSSSSSVSSSHSSSSSSISSSHSSSSSSVSSSHSSSSSSISSSHSSSSSSISSSHSSSSSSISSSHSSSSSSVSSSHSSSSSSVSSSSSSVSSSHSSSSSSVSSSHSSSSSSVSSSHSSSSSSDTTTAIYTRGDVAVLPADDSDLETAFGAPDYVIVSTDDGNRLSQTATGEFAVFLFKDKHTQEDTINVTWNGQSDVAPSASTVYLQIYNRNSTTWETLDSEAAEAADTDFNLEGVVDSNLSWYFDGSYWVACRVYQESV